MINFPDNPTVNQVFTAGSQTWIYDGAKWVAYGVAQGIYLPLTGGKLTGALNPAGGIIGVADGSDAAPGFVGEIISSAIPAGSVSLTNNIVASVTSIPLTAGDWDVSGGVVITPSAVLTNINGAIGPTATFGGPTVGSSRVGLSVTFASGIPQFVTLSTCRASLSAGANYYLIGQAAFASGTCGAGGVIWARRVR